MTTSVRMITKALREPRKLLFYSYFHAFSWTRKKQKVRVIGHVERSYLCWKVFRLLGLVVDDNGELVVKNIDATCSKETEGVNGACTDITKATVSRVFAEVFGYELDIDPARYSGALVVKSQVNAAHDGRIVQGPVRPEPGYVYQRLVDNESDGWVEDLRPCIVGREIAFVFRKKRPVVDRFSNETHRTTAHTADVVFTKEEQNQLIELARRLNLDMGELDVLRDRSSGRIYVVDAANTPHSPGNACLNVSGIRAMHRAADAFRRQFMHA